MRTFELADKTIVEATLADSYGGPGDCFSKMHVNSYALFYRKSGGEWKRPVNVRCNSLHALYAAVLECGTWDALEKLVGSAWKP